MCPVLKMQTFAIQHNVARPEVLPVLFSCLANRQQMDLEAYLETVERKPDLGDFIAEMATHWPQRES